MAKRTTLRVLIVLHFLKMNATDLANFLLSVAGKLPDADDPTPVVPKLTMQTQANDLSATTVLRVTDKSPSLTQTENGQINDCLNTLTYTAGQIEQIANDKAAGDVTIAQGIIARFGFQYKKKGVRPGRFFEAYKKEAPGKVWLRCPVAPKKTKVVYLWRFTKTPADDNSWSQPVQTSVSHVNLINLLSDTRYYFESAMLPSGKNIVIDVNNPQIDWGDAISTMMP